MKSLSPGDSISLVKGIGKVIKDKLDRLGISTVGDLLKHFPSCYLDFTKQVTIKEIQKDRPASFLATIENVKTFYSHNNKLITQATAKDSSGHLLLTWFNNPYIKRLVQEGFLYSIAGKPTFFGNRLTLVSPTIEEGNSFTINTKGLVPIYPQTDGVTSRWLRKKIYELLHEVKLNDPLGDTSSKSDNFLSLSEAIYKIHFPTNSEERWQADKRLSYNEHLRININNCLEREKLGQSLSVDISLKINSKTKTLMPFTLTKGQEKTIKQLEKDLKSKAFTHRLIQGETGSGKTAPLIFAANQSLAAGFSCAVLVPTEILANQHLNTFKESSLSPDNVILVTGSVKAKISRLPTLFIGTHALLNQLPVDISPPLAFVAIDEQHKFGVAQREILMNRKPLPHLFNLSATPIPRTVALGLLGDLEISNISHKPTNRLPVKTFVVSPTKFKNSPKWLTQELEKGNQIFVVCPNISEHNPSTSSVEKQALAYRKLLPKKFPLWSIHGRVSGEDQQKTLDKFKNTPGSILVSTSLIEVGIDIPSANIMIIHSAERFGLAQLHQLRGRVGRGEGQGYCFLVPSTDDEVETERLQLLQKYHNGLVLAQKDLRLRGAGEIYGEKQHGSLQTRLKYFWSKKLFKLSKTEAQKIVRLDKQKAREIASSLLTW